MHRFLINKMYRFCIIMQVLIISGCDDTGMPVSSGVNNDYYSAGIMFSLFITALCIKTILSMENFGDYRRSLTSVTSSADV